MRFELGEWYEIPSSWGNEPIVLPGKPTSEEEVRDQLDTFMREDAERAAEHA